MIQWINNKEALSREDTESAVLVYRYMDTKFLCNCHNTADDCTSVKMNNYPVAVTVHYVKINHQCYFSRYLYL